MFPIQMFLFRIDFASFLSERVEAVHLFRLERENNSPPRRSTWLRHINDCAKMRGQQSLLLLSLTNTHLTFIAATAAWSIHVWKVGFCPQGCFHTHSGPGTSFKVWGGGRWSRRWVHCDFTIWLRLSPWMLISSGCCW